MSVGGPCGLRLLVSGEWRMASGEFTILATPYSLFAIPCPIRRPDDDPGRDEG
jgi:hypothetical protein